MYKNLNCDLLGISGRQSEIIELALTYGFRGIDIDISDLVKRCERGNFESAARFLLSSKLRVSSFTIPVDLDADDASFASQIASLGNVAEIAGKVGAQVGTLEVPSQTDRLPYHEYFDVIRNRVGQIAKIFGEQNVRVAIGFDPTSQGETKQFKFIQDAEGFVALAKSCPDASIIFDAWNWFCGGGTPELLESCGLARVGCVRLGDCVEGVSQEAATLDDCHLPGTTGVIDSTAYLKMLVEAGLDLGVSARGRLSQTGQRRDAFIAATQEALDKVLVEAGLPSEIRKPEDFAPSYAGGGDNR